MAASGAPMFELKELFQSIDTNRDGTISNQELTAKLKTDNAILKRAVEHAGLLPDYYMLEQLDLNGDGRVTWDEFRQSLEPTEDSSTALLKTLFGRVDADADGKLTRKELTNALNTEPSLAVILDKAGLSSDHIVLEQLDTDHDGKVSWEEFQGSLQVAAREIMKGEAPMFELKELFLSIDANKDGTISIQELKAKLKADDTLKIAVQHAGLMPDYHMFEQMDLNGDGRVTWDEFRESLEPTEDACTALLKTLFGRIDADADGKLTRRELNNALSTEPCLPVILEKCGIATPDVMNQLDKDGDSKVSWEEFKFSLRKATQDEAPTWESPGVKAIYEADDPKPACVCCWP